MKSIKNKTFNHCDHSVKEDKSSKEGALPHAHLQGPDVNLRLKLGESYM